MRISLAQTIQLISQLNNEIRFKKEARREASTIYFLKNEVYTKDDVVNELTKEILTLRDRVRELKVEIGKKNVSTQVDMSWENDKEKTTLAEALVLVQQIRHELADLEDFGRLKEQPQLHIHRGYGGESSYYVANLDPEKYKRLADSLRRKANRLSTEIDRVNHNTFLVVDWAQTYIE